MVLSDTIGHKRSQAIWRVVGLVYLVTIYPIVAAVGFIGGLIFMVVDVILQALRNDAGLRASDGMGLAGWAARLARWPLDQLTYILIGEPDSFPWLP